MERNMDVVSHRSQTLSRDLVRSADLILAMGPHHLERIEALGGVGKAFLLADFASHGASLRAISDPIGAELDVYRATADELEIEIRRVLDRITAERASSAECHMATLASHRSFSPGVVMRATLLCIRSNVTLVPAG